MAATSHSTTAATKSGGRARTGRDDVVVEARAGSAWLVWVALGATVAAVIGWTGSGALLAVTARFDADADWNLHPALAMAGVLAATMAGVVATVVALSSRRLGLRAGLLLTLLWLGVAVLAGGGYSLSLAAPPGVGFVVAAGLVVTGVLAVVAAVAVATRRPETVR